VFEGAAAEGLEESAEGRGDREGKEGERAEGAEDFDV
jgi:hypothetical protein